jgi:hypothetical protein
MGDRDFRWKWIVLDDNAKPDILKLGVAVHEFNYRLAQSLLLYPVPLMVLPNGAGRWTTEPGVGSYPAGLHTALDTMRDLRPLLLRLTPSKLTFFSAPLHSTRLYRSPGTKILSAPGTRILE